MEKPEYIKDKAISAAELGADQTEAVMGGALMRAKNRKADLEENLKEANKEIEKIEEQLGTLMESRGLDKFFIKGLGTFYTDQVNLPSVSDEPVFFAWLDANPGHDISKRTVHHATLRSFVTELLESAQELPPGIKNFSKRRVRTLKARG